MVWGPLKGPKVYLLYTQATADRKYQLPEKHYALIQLPTFGYHALHAPYFGGNDRHFTNKKMRREAENLRRN